MSLLQLWAWTRILPLAPRITEKINDDATAPYGARWDFSVTHKESPSHVLVAHRTSLQNLLPNQFDWTPYRNVHHSLAQICTSGMQSWASQCF
ncbi:hypothetical protein QVD17_41947 [Tagetes erecta]|uniref:Aminotransferase-like plant mobile domain-containing protein n=1 Tax=Tagetes erecta TaxID=13708 RepID=A0AAD8JRI9_TARER|nr:hypothetical protein QVD17_41947 [Tagetes erecta]